MANTKIKLIFAFFLAISLTKYSTAEDDHVISYTQTSESNGDNKIVTKIVYYLDKKSLGENFSGEKKLYNKLKNLKLKEITIDAFPINNNFWTPLKRYSPIPLKDPANWKYFERLFASQNCKLTINYTKSIIINNDENPYTNGVFIDKSINKPDE